MSAVSSSSPALHRPDEMRSDPSSPTETPDRQRTFRQRVGGRVSKWLLSIRVYGLLIVTRFIVDTLPLKRITEHLGTPMEETPRDGVTADQLAYAKRVGRAINHLSPKTPTESNCYPKALTGRWLLQRKDIPTTFYYGAAFDADGTSLEAHVWLRCGNLIVTGGGESRRFTPLTWFAR